jgi:very-short-patch-repair endonuclease
VERDLRAAAIAERQLGLISHLQARRLGFSNWQIHSRVAAGRWERVRAQVYLVRGAPRSWPQSVLSAVLAAGDVSSFASHLTAARLWGLPAPRGEHIEVVTPLERRVRLPGIRAHRSGTLHELDVATLGSVPLTAPARTLGDLSSMLSVDELGRALDDGMRRGIVSLSAMHAVGSRFRAISPGRSPKTIQQVLATRIPGYEPGDSDLETSVWNAIQTAGLPAPVRLHRVRVAGRVLTIDLAYPSQLVGIEIDGFEVHRTRTAFDIDRVRQNALVIAGWTVLRFTSKSTTDEIASTVASALFGRSVTHSPTERPNRG